jgi:hypothetical protein
MGVKGHALWYDIYGNLLEVDPPREFVQTAQVVPDTWTKFSLVGRSPGVVRPIKAYSIVANPSTPGINALTFFLDTPNIMVRGETIVVEDIAVGIDGVYQIEFIGPTSIIVATTQSVTAGDSVVCEGVFKEAYPNTTPVASLITGGQIVDGIATVTFATAHGLSVGEKIIVNGMSTYFSFGVHTITAKTTNTVTFQIYEPYTGIINTTLDQGPFTPAAGTAVAIKILPGILTLAPSAYYGSFELVFADTGTIYLDLLQMARFEVPEFHEARAVEIFLDSTKTNYAKNPAFNYMGAAKDITRFNATTTTSATVYVANASTAYTVGSVVTIVAGTPAGTSPVNLPNYALGTWSVTAATSSTITISGSGFTVADTTGINATKTIVSPPEWAVVASSYAFDVNRTQIGRIGAGTSLAVNSYSPIAMTQYTVSSNNVTITTAANHTVTNNDTVVVAPPEASYNPVIAAVVNSNFATFTLAAPHSYTAGSVLLIAGSYEEFSNDFNNDVVVVTAVTVNTVTFATTGISNKSYNLSATPYGAVTQFHPVYGLQDVASVTSNTITFPVPAPLTWPNVTTPVALVLPVGITTSVTSVSAPVKSGRFITASVYAKAVKNKTMTFSTSTTNSDPGTGGIRFNNATYSSVTAIYVDNTDAAGTEMTYFLDSLLGSTITVKNVSTTSGTATYLVTAVSNSTGYRTLTVTHVSSTGTLATSSSGVTLSTSASEAIRIYATAIDVATNPASIVASSFSEMSINETWTRYSTTVFVPSVSPETVIVTLSVAGVTVGSTIYFDQAQIENAYTATDYFDGTLPAAYGAVWENPVLPHRAPTHLYPNLPVKITRLKQELPKYLPINASFLIQWHGGGIAKLNL